MSEWIRTRNDEQRVVTAVEEEVADVAVVINPHTRA